MATCSAPWILYIFSLGICIAFIDVKELKGLMVWRHVEREEMMKRVFAMSVNFKTIIRGRIFPVLQLNSNEFKF